MTDNQLIEDSDEESRDSEDISRDYLRISLVLSFLTQKELSINLVDPILPFEVSLLKLITRVTDGTRTEIDLNSIKVTPGRLVGGEFSFECDKSMPLTYYLEPLVLLLPFASKPTNVTLKFPNYADKTTNKTGSLDDEFLNNEYYSSLECFSSVSTILLQLIGCTCNFKYKEPFEAVFSCSPVKKVVPISLTKSPKVKRVRGSVTVRNIQPNLGKRAIIGAKKVLDIVCDNSFIYLSSPPGKFKPYLTMSLIAEGTNSCIFTSNLTVSLFSDSSKSLNSSTSSHVDADDSAYSTEGVDTIGNSTGSNGPSKSGTSSLKKILNLIEKSASSSTHDGNNATRKAKPGTNTGNTNGDISNTITNTNANTNANTTNSNTNTNTNANTITSTNTNTNANTSNTNRNTTTGTSGHKTRTNSGDEGLMEKCERMGEQCARRLCSEISLDSVVDTCHEHLFLFFMALAEDHRVSQIRLSKLTRYAVHYLRFIRTYLGVVFKFEELEDEKVLIVKCIGSNYQNINIESF
ncbi:RNA 3'-terminal phosphate cyclase [Theileria orientalis]|uniref:RNA 3'-terminal phosphate cyclase n=1 Tax=Theileria orientalis TaxID=68886 RepID=A0A976MBE6_THEOR|nr:RNA 3'-terminal phosphate cyclase [Theileria orientalis]